MAYKRLIVNKLGHVTPHAIRKKTLRDYRVVSEARFKGRWVNVYQKRGHGEQVKSNTYKLRPTLEELAKPMTGMLTKEEVEHPKLEVKGLVSVSYESKRKSFHAEMLFFWYGPVGFDEQQLLDNAVQVLMDTLPDIERIPFELASQVSADFDRRGIESVNPYSGQRENEMDFEIYIPKAGYGRALLVGSAMVTA